VRRQTLGEALESVWHGRGASEVKK
jgi:hypothetical protein